MSKLNGTRPIASKSPAGATEITRALSIQEPWAHLVASGLKPIENRTWAWPMRRPARIAIHASSSARNLSDRDFLTELADSHPAIGDAWSDERITPDAPLFQLGCIIGSVEVVGCVEFDPSDKRHRKTDDVESMFREHATLTGPATETGFAMWADGPWCWLLRDARRYRRAILVKGRLNLWEMSPVLRRFVAESELDLCEDAGEPVRDYIEVVP